MINVMLVKDNQLLTEGIKAIIEATEDMEVVAVAEDAEDAVERAVDVRPDVVLMDIHMAHAIYAIVQIKSGRLGSKVISVTTYADKELIITGINAGTDGFLCQSIDAPVLLQSVRNVANDQMVIAGSAAQILAEHIRDTTYDVLRVLDRKLQNRDVILNVRELEIAYMVMRDKTNPQIAERVHLSQGTVKNYISNIYHKLKIRTRKDTIVYLKGLFGSES